MIMKKLLIFLFIILCLSSVLSAADEKAKETLSLILPADTLSFGISADAAGTSKPDTAFYLLAYSDTFTASGNTPVSTASNKRDAASTSDLFYAYAAVKFYVYWEALVSSKVDIVFIVPEYLYDSSKSNRLQVVAIGDVNSKSGINEKSFASDGTEALVLSPGSNAANKKTTVKTLDSTQIYKGSQLCALIIDIKNAKKGVKYTGELELKVVTQS